MTNTLRELFRHKTWATLQLIAYCQGLADEHLDATIPGTFGTIRDTLRHIVEAEEGYFSRVTDEPIARMADGDIPLGELAVRLQRLGPRWEAILDDAQLASHEVTTSDGWRLPAALVMAQAIHHAGDHRSHILSIIGARGLEEPAPNGLDVWGYAEATKLMKQVN